MSPLLKNAVVSIQLGLEDFTSKDKRRVISAARNLYAGVLLLCKEVLRELSPPDSNELLIRTKKKAVKDGNGNIRLIGDGNKTIDRIEIVETFKQLQLSADLTNLKRLGEIRNDIEHLHARHAPALIHEAIADAMPIIRDVIVKELHAEPPSLLGNKAWNVLLDEARVFKEEQAACKASFDQIEWGSAALTDALKEFHCPKCSSALLRNDNTSAKTPSDLILVCVKCSECADLDKVVEEALNQSLWAEGHIAAKDGGDPVIGICPECAMETYVFAEGQCLSPNCGFIFEGGTCAICGDGLTLDDYERDPCLSLCGYHAYVAAKDD